jgi:hypothetical protein
MHLSGVLERSTPPKPAATTEDSLIDSQVDAVVEPIDGEPANGKGRGRRPADPSRKAQATPKTAKKMKGRTIYLPDDLFERVVVQSLRRGRTISEYVQTILERQVPDHRTIQAVEPDEA